VPAAPRPPIRIDHAGERLWRGEEPVALRPKTWAVLGYLSARPGALVTKAELLDAVWADTVVSEGTLNKSIGELRTALGDDRGRPRFIETVPRRGFRWIGEAAIASVFGGPATAGRNGTGATADAAAGPASPEVDAHDAHLIGRGREMDVLDGCFAQAASAARRQVVFVTGEAGTGKSALVDSFLARLDAGGAAIAAHGQCIETQGAHEPYRPILEALERLAEHVELGDSVTRALARYAPSWLRRMPGLHSEPLSAGEELPTSSSMLRELASAMEAIAREVPVVLAIEDVHWADLATCDACNLLARRRDPARLLLVVTMRLADAMVARHPMLDAKAELLHRRLASEITLAPFDAGAVADYLARRCPGASLDAALCSWIRYQTGGNPLFVRIVVDDLIERGLLARSGERWHSHATAAVLRDVVPDSLRELVDRQLARLSHRERSIVEAACVLADGFEPASVAAAAGMTPEEAEEACAELCRRGQILRRDASRGRRDHGERFAFLHSLVRRILVEGLPSSRLRRYHLAAAQQLEREHPEGTDTVALDLALHYSMAGDAAAAVANLRRAASLIYQVPAPREVVVIREQILQIVERNPLLPDYRRERITAIFDVATARYMVDGFADAETTELFERVVALAEEEDSFEKAIAENCVLWGRLAAGRYAEAAEIAGRIHARAQADGNALMITLTRWSLASVCLATGRLEDAENVCRSLIAEAPGPGTTFGRNLGSLARVQLATCAILRGRWSLARELVAQADETSRRDGFRRDAYLFPSLAHAHALMGNDEEARTLVEESLSRFDASSGYLMMERARFLQGLLLSRRDGGGEGVTMMQESMRRLGRRSGFERTSQCCLLAGEMLRLGLPGAAEVVDDAVAYMETSGERYFEADLYRLRAATRLQTSRDSNAEAQAERDLRSAIDAARARSAGWHEMMAANDLARLLHRQDRRGEARLVLETSIETFTGDDGLAELCEARSLLGELR